MHRRFRQVFCALKEHSFVGYAKMATYGGFCDISLVVVKATSPDDLPLPEKYITQLLKIFSISPSSFRSFAVSLSARFSKTHSWRVALKCLLLLHRLLRGLPDHSPFRAELLWTKSNGLLSLYPCRFRDDSSSSPGYYTGFIRSYARLLDEALDCICFEEFVGEIEIDEGGGEEELCRGELQNKMKQVDKLLDVLPQLQSLIDRVMECAPNGAAAKSFVVQSAMKYIIRDSFLCYSTFTREIVLVLDNLIEIPYQSCILAFAIYKKAAFQADRLSEFYHWCQTKGLCGAYEYPYIDRIPELQIKALENFLKGMWLLTESSSSNTSPTSWMETKSSSTEEDHKRVSSDFVVSTQWEKFDEIGFPNKQEMAPLIQFEDEAKDSNWEALLDASLSINLLDVRPQMSLSSGFNGYGVCAKEENNQWQMQVYNPNPFSQPHYIPCNSSWRLM